MTRTKEPGSIFEQMALEVTDRAPMRLAEVFLDAVGRDPDGVPTIRHWRDEWWRWRRDASSYRKASPTEMRCAVRRLLDQVVLRVETEVGADLRPFNPRDRDVFEVLQALPAVDDVLIDGDAPRALREFRPPITTPAGVIPIRGTGPGARSVSLRNGILDLDTSELFAPTPSWFATSSLGTTYDPGAGEPRRWIEFLHSLWPDDLESWGVLQEWCGYTLLSDTTQQKILLMVGPKRSGKGTIARILSALLGPDAVCSPTLSSLGTNFGAQPLLNKSLAIVSDARLGGRVDQAAVAERLLSISGEDGQTIDRKHLPAIHCHLPVRFMLLTNELPRLGDTSGALASRFIVLKLTRSFYGKEDRRLTDQLKRELPSIFLWALAGLRRLEARGYFLQPASARDDVEELERLGSPLRAFLEDRCVVEPDAEVAAKDLYSAWRCWCEDNGRERAGDATGFGRNLRSVLPTIRVSQPRIPGSNERRRVYHGVGLR
jgi:putative DNA primase/helicase